MVIFGVISTCISDSHVCWSGWDGEEDVCGWFWRAERGGSGKWDDVTFPVAATRLFPHGRIAGGGPRVDGNVLW